MSGSLDPKNLAAIMGNSPNESWTRVGQVISVISVFSILGIGIGGLEMGETSKYAPYITLMSGFFCMYYGGRLRKNLQIAVRNHELDMADKRKSDRPKSEPTRGQELFLEFIKPHLPVTVAELRELKFAYDEKRTKPELLIASKYQRMEFFVREGTIRKYGDQFHLRDSPADETIFGGTE